MRITFVLRHADLAGGVRVVATYAQRLHQRGHEVVVVSSPWPKVHLIDSAKSFLRGRGWPSYEPIRPSYLDQTDVKHHIIDESRPIEASDLPDADVVIATWWETAEWVAKLPASKGAKAYLIQHYEAAWGSAISRVDDTYRLPLHKITISRWLVDLMRDKFGDPNVSHIPNSADTTYFNAPPRSKNAVPTVGMLYASVPFKGCDVSLAAFSLAAGRVPGLRMVSFGKEEPSLQLPLPAGAQYTFSPPQDRIKEVYAQCDVWLCGSRSEGFHLPPLEAMACRCPVVSTRVGGPMDVIEQGVNGYLADVEDAAGLADGIERVVTLSETQWRKMSDAAYATANRYTWEDATDLLEAAISAAIDRSQHIVERIPLVDDGLGAIK